MVMTHQPRRRQAVKAASLAMDPWQHEAQRDAQLRAVSFLLAAVLLTPAFFLKFDLWTPVVLEEPAKPTLFVVHTPRFKHKTPEPIRPPEARRRLVPVPDPTPDDPEPLRVVGPLEIEPIIFEGEVPFEIPSTPPPFAEPIPNNGPLEIGGDVSRPVQIFAPSPRYTEVARRARRQGVVRLRAVIDQQGLVEDLELVSGLGFGLDQAALDTVRTWRFEPSRRNGQPVRVNYVLSITFNLN